MGSEEIEFGLRGKGEGLGLAQATKSLGCKVVRL